ncbi:hypothetical protein BDR26DRAFT_794567, partial [Obelidium mucronatum]
TIRTWLSGLGACYTSIGFEDWSQIRSHRGLALCLAGIQKESLRTSPDEKDPPYCLTSDDIKTVLSSRHPGDSNHDVRLFHYITVSGFFAMHRLNELTDPDDTEDVTPHKRITLSSVRADTENRLMATKYIRTYLPCHKADRMGRGCNIYLHNWSRFGLDTLAVAIGYLGSRLTLERSSNVLCLRSNLSVPTRSWYLTRLRKCLQLPRLGSKSLRAGGATFYAMRGFPAEFIQIQGRWSSE